MLQYLVAGSSVVWQPCIDCPVINRRITMRPTKGKRFRKKRSWYGIYFTFLLGLRSFWTSPIVKCSKNTKIYVRLRISIYRGVAAGHWWGHSGRQNQWGGKINILNENNVDFMHSTNFKVLSQINGNSINNLAFLNVINSIRGVHCDNAPHAPPPPQKKN
jgi:hypothetical protein